MPMNSTNSGLLGGIGVDRKIKELTKRYGGDDLSVGLLPSPPGLFEYPQGTIRSAPTDRFSGLISGALDTSMDSGLPSMKSDNQIAREAADAALGLGPENMAGGGGGRGAGLFRGLMATIGKAKGKGITAFHGSPYDFDKFSTSKLGTGEGHQAYGHGLYFAENEATAKFYRDTIAPSKIGAQADIIPEYFKPGNIIPSYGGGQDKVLKFHSFNKLDWVAYVVEVDKAGKVIPGARTRVHATPPTQKEVEKVLGKGMGKMYEVEIKAGRENLLDWDKPLSGQPESVRTAIEGLMSPQEKRHLANWKAPAWSLKPGESPNIKYEDAIDVGTIYGLLSASHKGGARGLSGDLLAGGVRGIKYLDQVSRGAGKGTSNFVVFDDETIEIIKKYGIAALVGGGAGLGLLGGGNAEATQ